MKKRLWSFVMLVAATFSMASCLSSDEVATAPECAILSWSVGSIKSNVLSKKYDSQGNATDTIVSKTLAGSDIYFNIDQVNGHIYTVDSLPNWVDLTRVVPTFTSYGQVFGQVVEGDELYYALTSGSDSIDFSKTVELVCISTDGLGSKHYKVDIYQHQYATDTLEWTSVTTNLDIQGESKVFSADDKVFVFAANAEGNSVVTYASMKDATTWSTPVSIPIELGQVVMWDGKFYGLGGDGYIYAATSEEQAATWTKVSEKQVKRLLAADAYYLYAYDGTAIVGTEDLDTWTVQGTSDLDMLPETSMNAFSYASSTNTVLQVVVMTGLSNQNNTHGVSWYKLTSQDNNANQPWAYIQVTLENVYGLPHLDYLSTTYYKGALYAIGATAEGTYEYLYRSDDNGITWHPQTEMYPVPADLSGENGAASIAAVGNSLWILQENGKIWRGSIQ